MQTNQETKAPRLTVMVSEVLRVFDLAMIRLSQKSHDREAARMRGSVRKHACEFACCGDNAVHFIQWGSSVKQQGNVCEKHMRETWEKVGSQVAAGACWWKQTLPR